MLALRPPSSGKAGKEPACSVSQEFHDAVAPSRHQESRRHRHQQVPESDLSAELDAPLGRGGREEHVNEEVADGNDGNKGEVDNEDAED